MKNERELIVPTNIHVMMSGAACAEIFGKGSPRVVRLTYTDGTNEEAYLTAAEIAAGKDNWFAMVSAVQETSRKAGEPVTAIEDGEIVAEYFGTLVD